MKGDTNSLSNVDIFSKTLPFVKIVWKFIEKTQLPSARPVGTSPVFRTHESLCGPADHVFPPLNDGDGNSEKGNGVMFRGSSPKSVQSDSEIPASLLFMSARQEDFIPKFVRLQGAGCTEK